MDEDEDGGNYYYRCETIKGYEYTSHATIAMEADEDAYGKVWLALLETDGSFTFEFEFDLKNEEAVERELLAKAVKQAQSRAEILAEAAGAKLGNVMSINHTMRNAYSGYGLDYMCCESPRPSSYGKRNLIPDFNPEDITVCCSVDVAWSIDKLE